MTRSSVALTTSSESPSPSPSRLATPDTNASADDNNVSRSRTPTVSISPPPARQGRSESLSASLANGLDNVHLASPVPATSDPDGLNMSALAAAVETVERGADEQAALPETLLPETPPATPGTLRLPSSAPASQSRPRSRRRSRASSQSTLYDIEKEEVPPHRLYSQGEQQALRDSKSLVANLATALGISRSRMHEDQGSTVHRLHRQATALANFQLPPSWTVGFAGDTGAGKSSMLNSLLHHKNLVKESSNGRACTSVVTEFRYRAGDDCIIEVELFPEEKLLVQLASLVRAYRSHHLPERTPQAPDRDVPGTNTAEEESRAGAGVKEDATYALSMLWALFGKQLDDYMQLLLEGSEEYVLAVLKRHLLDNRSALSSQRQVFASVRACSDRLRELTVDPRIDESEGPPDEPISWPYIRAIKVFLNSPILSKGLVLVDLPGLGDRNAAREAVTENYLVRCNEVFAVYRIDRIVSNPGVERVIKLAQQVNLDNVGIICTRSEQFGNEGIDITLGPKARQARQLDQQIPILSQEVKGLEEELSFAIVDEYDSSEEEIDKAALQREIWQKQAELKTCIFNLLQLRIQDRNENVEKQIKSAYKDKIPGGVQQFFCVSNTQYWKYWDKTQFLPEIHLSGIPKFRMHCLAKVADSQLVLAAKYIRDNIPALLGEVELWVESGAGGKEAEKKKAVREALDMVERDMTTRLSGRHSPTAGMSRSMKATFDTKIYKNRDINKPRKWAHSALEAAGKWENGWSPMTYIAFCRQYGEHKTTAVGWHSWNAEAMKSMVDDLNYPWDEVRQTLEAEHDEKLKQIENLIDDEKDKLDIVAPPALLCTISSRNSVLNSEIQNCVNKFESDLSALGKTALSGIRTGLFGAAMEDTYNAARLEKGSKCTVRKYRIMNHTLGDRGLFEGVIRDFRDEFNKHAQSLERDMQMAVLNYLEVIRVTFDMIRSENAASESESDLHFTGRVSTSVTATKADLGRLKDVVLQR